MPLCYTLNPVTQSQPAAVSKLPVDPSSNEIPVARRESVEVSLAEVESADLQHKSSSRAMLLSLVLVSFAGLGGVAVWQKERTFLYINTAATYSQKTILRWKEGVSKSTGNRANQGNQADQLGESTDHVASLPVDATGDSSELADKSIGTLIEDPTTTASSRQPDRLLNHRRYDVADIGQLVPLSSGSDILLQPEAQAKLSAMLADANASGVRLGVISGFRTIEDQNYLYFDVKAERGESAKVRAEVSAPPGYSEHHTGYAVDFVDQSQPDTFLEESFETTPAYKWLVANAPFYNFEMSFPKDNGAVTYEPWHWRYVGNQESLELFYR
ncbi:D-alanyl-D-alanine carboxypeptidase family [Synechococcus sp. PCC 7335]|uniref:M15 family metallopeptidase n=1 Tax=Synechococcus sp. (strain ATCC 29403 / PCC 7335) TaxID=91464 RepID=UPI00017ECE14|nr:M15 family metallopeptidase [Synechococcus sp. PCC 7335]EDX84301.1 D-alanyl-D-alanine carboxypeptidase family [Synechococcus sp. PCC 7335]